MAGCGVGVADLMEMARGLLGEGSLLRGIDLRGNEVTQEIVDLFASNGFEAYVQFKVQPFGVIFAKP